jgi:hypothetical protein
MWKYCGWFDVARRALAGRARGRLTGLYRGTPATLALRTFVGQAVALSVYARLMANAPGGTT